MNNPSKSTKKSAKNQYKKINFVGIRNQQHQPHDSLLWRR
ncbi:hypothetical protein FORMA_17020 [Formosa sp. Hel3_A1_48]|nr:hypothetical protein FORMA_17020 [Formosa sp. Hel3_A1_48]